MAIELYNTFDKINHLQPVFDKKEFDTLHGWDFGWAILEMINIAESPENEKELSLRFSPGQKALYFFWYLDGQVTNGGFIQFYFNEYQEYVSPIIDGLKLIGDIEMLTLLIEANDEYSQHKRLFDLCQDKGDWSPLYDQLKAFDVFDETYFKIHDNTMLLIENYARQNHKDFVRFN